MCVGEELRTLRIAAALKVRSIFGGLFRFAERNCGHFAALKKGTRLVRSLFIFLLEMVSTMPFR